MGGILKAYRKGLDWMLGRKPAPKVERATTDPVAPSAANGGKGGYSFTPVGSDEPLVYNADNSIVFAMPERLNQQQRRSNPGFRCNGLDFERVTYDDFQKALTGHPDYTGYINDYWSRVSDKDWEKVFHTPKPRPGERRYAFWTPPLVAALADPAYNYAEGRIYGFKGTDPAANFIRYLKREAPQVDRKRPQIGPDSKGAMVNALAMSAVPNAANAWLYGHELTHANQIGSMDENDIRAIIAQQTGDKWWINGLVDLLGIPGQVETTTSGVDKHPGLKIAGRSQMAFNPKNNAWYTGNVPEEARAAKLLNDAFMGQQNIMRKYTPADAARFNLTPREFREFMSFEPRAADTSKGREQFRARNAWLKKHPRAMKLLGDEAVRFLYMLEEYERRGIEDPMMNDYWLVDNSADDGMYKHASTDWAALLLSAALLGAAGAATGWAYGGDSKSAMIGGGTGALTGAALAKMSEPDPGDFDPETTPTMMDRRDPLPFKVGEPG